VAEERGKGILKRLRGEKKNAGLAQAEGAISISLEKGEELARGKKRKKPI